MTYGKLSDRCLKVFVVLLIAGVLGGFCLPHFVEAVAGGYNTRAVGISILWSIEYMYTIQKYLLFLNYLL